jgi:hypothetical protein
MNWVSVSASNSTALLDGSNTASFPLLQFLRYQQGTRADGGPENAVAGRRLVTPALAGIVETARDALRIEYSALAASTNRATRETCALGPVQA